MVSLRVPLRIGLGVAVTGVLVASSLAPALAATPKYDINTLAGKLASLRGTAGLQIRFSAFLEQEAEEDFDIPAPGAPITPAFVLSSPLDGNSILAPNVTVNQDTAAAPQNETAIAVDPNNANRIVTGSNDYAPRTWTCFVSGTPCSALGEAFSGTNYSNDGGATWCCTSSDPAHLGTLIPGINHLGGGQYDAAGDPSVAFDSNGHVYYAGLGFDRAAPPNTVAVNRGTFDGSGNLTWSAPVFINQTTSPSTLNDKEWIAVDQNASSPFRDRIYVTWTRFLFNAHNGAYTQSPIFFATSSDGGHTFSSPKSIAGNVLYGQGSRPVVGAERRPVRLLGWRDAPCVTGLDLHGQVDGRRCDMEQAAFDFNAGRLESAARHGLPREQLPGRGCRPERRSLRGLDDADQRRIRRHVQQVDR